jgi:hypothetical protein
MMDGMPTLPRPEALIAEYRRLAEPGANFLGLSIIRHRDLILKLIRRFSARTLLDYGSGRGDAYTGPSALHAFWKVRRPVLYDPAFPTHDVLPVLGFDGVLCSDVLEHIHPDDVDHVIDDLFRYAERFTWASVCTRPAKKAFPSGLNMHTTIQPIEWWRDRFTEAASRYPGVEWCLTETH